MIRLATPKDIPAIVALGEAFFTESPAYAPLVYAPEKIRALAENLIGSRDGYVRVIDKGGGLLGGMMGMICEHWAARALVATEIVLFVQPGSRGQVYAGQLVGEFREWGRLRGAHKCMAGTSSAVMPEMCARLYERCGFTRASIGLEFVYV
jgi:GNAT superfamily N-acetyltransferase